MTIEEIRKNAPEGSTHYAEDAGEVFYMIHVPELGYLVVGPNYYLDEYEVYLYKPKPL